MRTSMPIAAILLTLAACTASGDAKPPLQSAQVVVGREAAGNATAAASTDQIAFDNLKKLVGRWEAPMANKTTMVDTFRTFAFGSAILGEEWVDGQQITSTVFYMVGPELRADHYCDYLNQPRYLAKTSADPSVVQFVFREATNLEAHARHFHSTTWRFVDATHLTQDWSIEGGPKGTSAVHMEFVRKE